MLHEHKSWYEKETIFQVLRYASLLWDAQLRAKKGPICIFPDVIYHGGEAWKVQSLHDFFTEIPSELRPFIPQFQFQLTNLHDLEASQIIELEAASLVTAFFLLRYSKDSAAMLAQLEKLAIFVDTLKDSSLKKRLVLLINEYVITVHPDSKEEIMESFIMHRPTLLELAMQSDLVVNAQKKGIEQGIEQEKNEVIKAMFKDGFGIDRIARLTKISETEVFERLQKMNLID